MEQTKALNALEPFLALSKSATSSRAAIDLITHATSAQNTFIFAELLNTPQIARLQHSPDTHPHHRLLDIFAHGTYQDYLNAAASDAPLPPLNDSQRTKLRQLSLLSLASDRNNLSYNALKEKLDISDTRELENTVISAVYAGLIVATLDPARQAVQVTSLAPLRDLRTQAIPDMITVLKRWSSRCTSTLSSLDAEIESIRSAALKREADKAKTNDALAEAKTKLMNSQNQAEATAQNDPRLWRAILQGDMASSTDFDSTLKAKKSARGKRKM